MDNIEVLEKLMYVQWRLDNASDRLILIEEGLKEKVPSDILYDISYVKKLCETVYDIVSAAVKDVDIKKIKEALRIVKKADEYLQEIEEVLDKLEKEGRKNWDKVVDYNFDDASNFINDVKRTLNKILDEIEEFICLACGRALHGYEEMRKHVLEEHKFVDFFRGDDC